MTREQDVRIAILLGWKFTSDIPRNGTLRGRPPGNRYEWLIPHYTTSGDDLSDTFVCAALAIVEAEANV